MMPRRPTYIVHELAFSILDMTLSKLPEMIYSGKVRLFKKSCLRPTHGGNVVSVDVSILSALEYRRFIPGKVVRALKIEIPHDLVGRPFKKGYEMVR